MTRASLEKVAWTYRQDGYDVRVLPSPAELPEFLRNFAPDLIATMGDENVVVEVKEREDLVHNSAMLSLAAEVNAQPGWRLDLVVERNTAELDSVAAGAVEPNSCDILRLADSAERLVGDGELIAACLVGWSATEAALRFTAHLNGLSLESKDPTYVLNALATEGVIARDEYDALIAALQVRNAMAHGLKPVSMNATVSEFLIETTRRLLQAEMSPASAS